MPQTSFAEIALDLLPGLVALVNGAGQLKYWNHRVEEATGYSSEELANKSFLEFFEEEHRNSVDQLFESVSVGEEVQLEQNLIFKESVVPYKINVIAISHDGADHYLAIALDNSDETKIREELALSQALHEQAQKIAGLGHWEMDHDSGALVWSKEVYRIFDLDPESTTPTYESFLELVHPDDRVMVDQVFSESAIKRKPYGVSHRLRETQKGVKYVRESGHTLYDDNGNPTRSIGTVQDITQLKDSEKTLAERNAELSDAMMGIVDALSKALESRDAYTAGHQSRVAEISRAIAEEMKLNSQQIEGLVLGAKVHDIGKLSVPVELLTKPTALTEMEFSLIQSHPAIGAEILSDVTFPWPIAEIVAQHHERIDGSGYPNGLSGEDICLEARIVAVADVYEAISSHRPYRASKGPEAAIMELKQHRGKFYDENVVDAFLRIVDSLEV